MRHCLFGTLASGRLAGARPADRRDRNLGRMGRKACSLLAGFRPAGLVPDDCHAAGVPQSRAGVGTSIGTKRPPAAYATDAARRGTAAVPDPVDNGGGIARQGIAAPGDMAIGSDQDELAFIERWRRKGLRSDLAQWRPCVPAAWRAARRRGLWRRDARAINPSPYKSSIERPSASQACGARAPAAWSARSAGLGLGSRSIVGDADRRAFVAILDLEMLRDGQPGRIHMPVLRRLGAVPTRDIAIARNDRVANSTLRHAIGAARARRMRSGRPAPAFDHGCELPARDSPPLPGRYACRCRRSESIRAPRRRR